MRIAVHVSISLFLHLQLTIWQKRNILIMDRGYSYV